MRNFIALSICFFLVIVLSFVAGELAGNLRYLLGCIGFYLLGRFEESKTWRDL